MSNNQNAFEETVLKAKSATETNRKATSINGIGSKLSDSNNSDSGADRYNFDDSKNLQKFLETPEKTDLSKAAIVGNSIVYEGRWKVTVYWAQTLKYPKGAFLVEFKFLKYSQSSQSYLLHDLLNDNKLFQEALSTLCVFGGDMTRQQFEALIICASKLEKMSLVVETTPVVFNSLLGGALNGADALTTFEVLEEELLFDLEKIALLSKEYYHRGIHKAIVLDTPEYVGKGLVAVTPYTVMDILVWDEDTTRPERSSYSAQSSSPKRNEILQIWEDSGFLKVFSKDKRKGQKIKGISTDFKDERFYILEIPKVYEALKGGNHNG